MKMVMRRSFRSAAVMVVALLVGLVAVPVLAGTDAACSAEALGNDAVSQCPLSSKAKVTSTEVVRGATDMFLAALLGDAEAGAKIAAALAKENETCDASVARTESAATSAKLSAVVAADPSTCSAGKLAALAAKAEAPTCSAHAKLTKVTAAEPSACSASKADVAAKTEAVDAKIAKVAADAPASCAKKATQDKVAKVVATPDIPACCQNKQANSEEAGD